MQTTYKTISLAYYDGVECVVLNSKLEEGYRTIPLDVMILFCNIKIKEPRVPGSDYAYSATAVNLMSVDEFERCWELLEMVGLKKGEEILIPKLGFTADEILQATAGPPPQIWKYVLKSNTKLEMPMGAQILCVQNQDNVVCMWVLVDPSKGKIYEDRIFQTYATGQQIPHTTSERIYIGTVQERGYVWHIFELILK